MCTWCGNTEAFNINLKLRHLIQIKNGHLEVMLFKAFTDKVLRVIKHNMDRLIERCYDGKKSFYCANCNNTESIDYHERVVDCCWSMGCPGCFWCGSWIDKDDLVETCTECITDRNGEVDNDYCGTYCPAYDNGLEEVRQHYNITLDEMKKDLGYR
jgi:hypothetical protein|tara:strand:- start:5055 stop:5522 length:468 start_codon:yes stop_codon:yes gene_type:complete